MKVNYAYDAQSDLLEIHKWIHKDNPKRANSFIDELEQICLELGDTPLAYPVVLDENGNQVRRRVWRNYLIFYRVELNVLVILRVGHAAQNWSKALFP
jgi:toxin ParE1/3/4